METMEPCNGVERGLLPGPDDVKPRIAWGMTIAALLLITTYYVISAAHRGFDVPDYNYRAVLRDYIFGVAAPVLTAQFWKIVLVLPATLLAAVALAHAGIRFMIPRMLNVRTTIVAGLIIAATLLVISSQLIFRQTEVTDDENTYDFQAKTLLMGRLVNPPPPVLPNFNNIFIINDGKQWLGKYTLGHPLILAAGMAMGNAYILTITFSVFTLLLVYLIAMQLYGDKRIALLAFGLGAVSPFFYFVSSSRLSHTTTAFFLALFIYLFLLSRREEAHRSSSLLWGLLSGLALGYAFNVRSLTALGFAVPFCVIVALDIRARRPGTASRGITLAAGFGVIAVLTLWYNAHVTGSPFLFPFNVWSKEEALGFGTYGHTVFAGFSNLGVSIARMNGALLGFPLSVLFVFAMVFRRKSFGDLVLFGLIGGVALGYLFYYSPGIPDFGPLYYYETIVPLLLLSARGIMALHNKIASMVPRGNALVPNFLFVSIVLSFATYFPEQISHFHRLTSEIREPYAVVQAANVHNALVLVTELRNRGWVWGIREASPNFKDDVIYAFDAFPESNRALIDAFPDRTPFILDLIASNKTYQLMPANSSQRVSK